LATSKTTVLPFFGSRATVDGSQVLALAFALPSSPGGPLARLLVVAWPLGSCSHPVVEKGTSIPS
jgi:hypothetical protein